jgi:hypothetical protein
MLGFFYSRVYVLDRPLNLLGVVLTKALASAVSTRKSWSFGKKSQKSPGALYGHDKSG